MPDSSTPTSTTPSTHAPPTSACDIRLGYCTNVHAGHDLATTIVNLREYAGAVRRNLRLDQPLDVGLWLAADAAREAVQAPQLLRETLEESNLRLLTFNGFPYGNFHQPVVKHAVYEPGWDDPRRLAYTADLVTLAAELTKAGDMCSISTVPIGWPGPPCARVDLAAAAEHLRRLATVLIATSREQSRHVCLSLEPEPGCILGSSNSAARFFADHLLTRNDRTDQSLLDHIGICHDVCHSAVIFEDQSLAFDTYRAAGITVHKVQISSAISARFTGSDSDEAVLAALRTFAEPRYLHQTYNISKIEPVSGSSDSLPPPVPIYHEDLPAALLDPTLTKPQSEARVHFHVPIFMESIGPLGTTRDQIAPAISCALRAEVRHFEVETYAWNVLPGHDVSHVESLAAGIAREMKFAGDIISRVPFADQRG